MHGLMAGALLFVIKWVMFLTGHWMFKVSPYYAFATFIPILIGMFMASMAEQKLREKYNFWQALLVCLVVIAVAVFLSQLAEQFIYRFNPQLAVKTKEMMLKVDYEAFKKIKFVTEKDKQDYLTLLENADPKEMYSIVSMIFSIVTYTVLNTFWGIFVALLTRKRVAPIL